MDSFESLHYIDEWGPLLSEAGDLVSVADMVRWQMLVPLPLIPAIDLVLDAIERDGLVKGYLTSRGNWAAEIRDNFVWPDTPVNCTTKVTFGIKRPGLPGLIDFMRGYWRVKARPESLYKPILGGCQLAILLTDAERLFGRENSNPADVNTAPAVIQYEPAAAPEQPAEPVWKIDGQWQSAAKARMRQQRRDGMSETAIAKHWGFSRQNLSELIGSRQNPKD